MSAIACADTSQLEALLEDILPKPEQTQLEEHLSQCETCRQRIESLAADSGWWDRVRQSVTSVAAQDHAAARRPACPFLEPRVRGIAPRG